MQQHQEAGLELELYILLDLQSGSLIPLINDCVCCLDASIRSMDGSQHIEYVSTCIVVFVHVQESSTLSLQINRPITMKKYYVLIIYCLQLMICSRILNQILLIVQKTSVKRTVS